MIWNIFLPFTVSSHSFTKFRLFECKTGKCAIVWLQLEDRDHDNDDDDVYDDDNDDYDSGGRDDKEQVG